METWSSCHYELLRFSTVGGDILLLGRLQYAINVEADEERNDLIGRSLLKLP